MKRSFDFFVSVIGLVLLSPFLILISLLIKLQDNGPVIFKQERVGENGKLFVMYKFRSMWNLESAEKGSFEPGNDSRITPIGRFLRRTKTDELPQLFNVLKGDMSLVGPRPEVEKWVAVYPEKWKQVLTIRPGITDNAAIVYRNEESILATSEDPEKTYKEFILPHKLTLYKEYVNSHTFWGDLELIYKTICSVTAKRNASH